MSKELVIAAYERDYSWSELINKDVKITVYRKGSELKDGEILIEPNLGRDVHTFFYHILKNYDNLSDYTFFVQDFPFDHWSNVIETINGGDDLIFLNSTLKFDGYFGYHVWPDSRLILNDSIHFEGGRVLTCTPDGSPHHPDKFNVNDYWEILFDSPAPDFYDFLPGGHFGITKENVKIRSLEFYKKIVEILETEKFSPWAIERLECYIFNKRYKAKI